MSKYLSRPEEIILLSVLKLDNNAYGVSIREMVQDMTGKYWSIGAVYVPLERLENIRRVNQAIWKDYALEPIKEK